LVLAVGVWAAYTYENDWTGFHDYQPKTGEPERGKTLWDWLDLLIIPAALALGALWINWVSQKNEQKRADRENQIEREIASERNQEAALQNYLDKMTELLLKEALRASQPGDEVRIVARTRILTILRGLEQKRKGSVVKFLGEAGLITKKETEPIVSLSGADLTHAHLREAHLTGADLTRADLTGVDLTGANLTEADLKGATLTGVSLKGADLTHAQLIRATPIGANLTHADLRGADLTRANLTQADLTGTNLTMADLTMADLRGADLTEADLTGATLIWANLTKANLIGADLTKANLTRAKLKEAILPDGTPWTEGTDISQFTNPPSSDSKRPI
jgi:uncharacterized protein YjbI with pentapeptide repeats